MNKNPIFKLQDTMLKSIIKQAKCPLLPKWLDTRDTEKGSACIFIDKRTKREVEVKLCDINGFLQAIHFLYDKDEKDLMDNNDSEFK